MRRWIVLICLAGGALFGAFRVYRTATDPAQSETPSGFYRCSMHPEYVSKTPGVCPICGMSLTRVTRNQDSKENSVSVPIDEQIHADIQIERVTRRRLSQDISASGEIILDSPVMLKSPIEGTVDAVFVNVDGVNPVAVRKNALILAILTAGTSQAVQPLTEMRSPANAWITVNSHPGIAVEQEAPLMFYSSLDTVPVIAEIPLDIISFVARGPSAEMTCDCQPGKTWHGSVTNVSALTAS